MKKAIVIVVLFAILAITFTATMINIKRASTITQPDSNSPSTSQNPIATKDIGTNEITNKNNYEYLYDYEKTLDIVSTFDEPSIEFEEVSIDINGIGTRKIFQIKGLKDKLVENKINEDIKNRCVDKIREKYKKISEESKINPELTLYSLGKLPNVISAKLSFGEDNHNFEDSLYLNYELVTGKRLHLEDLFVKDFDTSLVTNKIINNWLENENNSYCLTKYEGSDDWDLDYIDDYEMYSYDADTDEWKETYQENSKPIIALYTEADALRKYSFWQKHKDDFFFDRVGIKHDEDYYYFQPYTIDFDSIPESVVIYDKYKTKESIYEDDSIGRKDILVCYRNMHLGDYSQTYFDDDLFYDYSIGYLHIAAFSSHALDTIEYPIKEVVEKLEKRLLDKTKTEIEKYKELLKTSDDAYFLSFYGEISPRKMVWSMGYDTIENTGLSSALECNLNAIIIKLNKDSFKEELPKLIKVYNKENSFKRYWLKEQYDFKEEDLDSFVYNSFNDKYYNSWNEVEEEVVCSPIVNSSVEHINIYINDPTLYDEMTNEILYDENRYSDDTLNKMYNEIFARHGHDFKSQELKDYFSLFDWYKPIEGKTVSMEELNETEKENLEFIKMIINKRK